MEKENQKQVTKEYALESIITTSAKLPGVKVNRDSFLAETFATEKVPIQDIVDRGPIEAGISREDLFQISTKLILKRTSQSSIASFTAGFPGGVAMAATVPLDISQFFGMSIRLAQELSYLYGAEDLWENGNIDEEKVKNQLIMYCGVMFGVSGAVSGVRVLSTQIAKTTLKKLPQKALTKTFWYPMIKQIGKAIGVKVTKSTVAKGISNAIPVIGGVISGSMNFASMLPMANRLQSALESANFGYTEEDLEKDIDIIEATDFTDEPDELEDIKAKVVENGKKLGNNISNLFSKKKKEAEASSQAEDPFEAIKKLADLKDMGILSQEEFDTKKAELLTKI